MSAQKSVRQEPGTVGENPVRLDEQKAEQIIEALNADLADAYVLYTGSTNTTGTSREHRDVHVLLQEAYEALEKLPTRSPSDCSRPVAFLTRT